MTILLDLSLVPLLLVFLTAAILIGIFGTWMTRAADILADQTGLGEAMMGGIFLGAFTSLSGITTSVTAAWSGHPELAVSNALGGIAVQTVFLAIADLFYRKANLEHAAASLTNILQAILQTVLLAFLLLITLAPPVRWGFFHPASLLLLCFYGIGLRFISLAVKEPMWLWKQTSETKADKPEAEENNQNLKSLWTRFLASALVVGLAGFVVAKTGIEFSQRFGISEAMMGGLFTAVITSLPELVVSIVAVRRGALTLAVGGIVGGNCFDVLFVSFADFAYFSDSIYHAISSREQFLLALTILLVAVLSMGLVARQKYGWGRIGFESVSLLILYLGAMVWLSQW